jgi:hypothetical protein
MPVFTDADTLRPGFSLAMELLCCLPPSPAKVSMSKLARDLALGSQTEVFELIDALRAIGFEINVTNAVIKAGEAGRQVCIYRPSWIAAVTAGGAYWDAVYGEGGANVIATTFPCPPPVSRVA